MTPPRDAEARQNMASDPAISTWLTANAGSGKTKVLTDRVSRLLLAGTLPQRILCLTYTKAAAGEMQNRLFEQLGRWAMLPQEALRGALAELGTAALSDRDLARARRLFAQAIETPGGLRIQTIHSFCASLLRRFPLEAGVSPRFTELDDAEARLLRSEVVEAMADGGDTGAVDGIAEAAGEADLAQLLSDICAQADCFAGDRDEGDFLSCFGLPKDCSARSILGETLAEGDEALLAALVPHLAAGGRKAVESAARIARLSLREPSFSTLTELEAIFLTATGENAGQPRAGFPEVAIRRTRAPHLMADLDALMGRVARARTRRLAHQAAQKSHALYRFGRSFLARYAAEKTRRGTLDFDDLVGHAAALLSDQSVAAWVLFRLDGGLDHILVDEAQDTSPRQWRVIERLTEEFTAGLGSREDVRTLFVVGDKKQSIYSFQGADVREFDAAERRFARRFEAIGRPMQSLPLEHSFRSSLAILDVVDFTFEGADPAALGGRTNHIPFFPELPGRVDLWEPIPKAEKAGQDDYDDPAAMVVAPAAEIRLAQAVARQVRAILDAGTAIPLREGSRPAHAGDVLILVQRRSLLYAEIIRACKAAGLPVAGNDRLKLSAELAVRDIAALLAFLSLPEDDLSLATALRSPLFGLTERQLFSLAHQPQGRRLPLWAALRARSGDFPEVCGILSDLLGQADFLRPYELVERMLVRHDMRRRLVARLGPEAEDGIDELLSQALDHERSEAPSLTGFLARLQTDEIEARRQTDGSARAIRVMTVHGAKGLEAPIVILPDTGGRKENARPGIVTDAERRALWRVAEAGRPEALARAVRDQEARRQEELLRLLYVAMTRAVCWLIVCGAGDRTEAAGSWHGIVRAGMARAGATAIPPDVAGLPARTRYEIGRWPEATQAAPEPPADAADGSGGEAAGDRSRDRDPDRVPPWALTRPPPAMRDAPPLSPSSLGGPKALPGEDGLDEALALALGTGLHRLLEDLPDCPASGREALAGAVADLLGDSVSEDWKRQLAAEALALIGRPHLAPIFAPGGLSEVEVFARLPEFGNRSARGIVDRLIVAPDRVLAIDYKTNRVVPRTAGEVPLGLLRQLGLYHAMLSAIYPGRRIEVAFLWTRTAELMPVPAEMVRSVLQSTPIT
ncbi:MAG: double-strand break repair helicase AddA [Pseudomonadota bacterium]